MKNAGGDGGYGGAIGTDALIAELRLKYVKRGQEPAWAIEEPHWRTILDSLQNDTGGISYNYDFDRVLGLGGAGAVFRVIDRNLYSDLTPDTVTDGGERLRRSYRALKVPRPHLEKGPTLADALREEISRLTALAHPNVVGVYAKGQIAFKHPTAQSASEEPRATTWPWYIMSYINDATDLAELCAESCPTIPQLIKILYQAAIGLAYIHRNDIVHCDIKPANIFLSRNPGPRDYDVAVLADFGYAKHRADSPDLTTIGFTEYFAHPDLLQEATRSSEGSRSFTRRPRRDIRPEFDLFAFGMTIHYLLETHYRTYGVYDQYAYELKFLRLCAARLLDGLNHQKGIGYGKLPDYAFRDQGTKGTHSWVPGLRYRSAKELESDFAKLLGISSPEAQIQELIDTRRENIQVSDLAPTIYTRRLRAIVDHPLVRRLGGTSQLGLVSLVYPGANHSRLEHALGVVGVTAKYLRALYYDNVDPLFCQVVTAEDMKATLIASLLHDIGQYPLAHDLEDVSMQFFSHETFGAEILAPEPSTDPQVPLFNEPAADVEPHAKTFAALVYDEWGVSLDKIRRILKAKSSEKERPLQRGTHIERLCKSIIDGPIDVDKVDYLRRDSQHCNVQYGNGIDLMRLCRCLTVAYTSVKDGQLLLVVGVDEKGRIPAESVLWARYAMLTQVYWHHTMRNIKAFLQVAAGEALTHVNRAGKASWNALRQDFFRCAILGEQATTTECETAFRQGSAIGSIHPGDLRVLKWLWLNTSRIGRVAVEHILNRGLFRRLLVVYRSELTDGQRRTLDHVFAPDNYDDRLRLRKTIESALLTRLRAQTIPDPLLATKGFSRDDWLTRLQDESRLRCLVDYPALRPGASFGLRVVQPWGELPRTGDKEMVEPHEFYPTIIPSDHFRDGMRELNKSIACLRIFWSPDEYVVVRDGLGAGTVRHVVMDEITRFIVSDIETDEEEREQVVS